MQYSPNFRKCIGIKRNHQFNEKRKEVLTHANYHAKLF